MTRFLRNSFSILALQVIICFTIACSVTDKIDPAPTITINDFDTQHLDECISGSVVGVKPDHFFIAIYAEIYDQWFSVPSLQYSMIDIAADHSWFCPINPDKFDDADQIQIFLLPAGFEHPALWGEKALPVKLYLAAVAQTSLTLKSPE